MPLPSAAEGDEMLSAASNIDRVPGLRALQQSSGDTSGIAIAVIDGPVETSHAAFGEVQLTSLDPGIRASHASEPSRAHGTHVASVLFGRSGGPVEGVAPGCRALLIPIFSDSGDGGIRPCSEIDLARALMLASDHGANVINISAGRLSGTGAAGAHLEDAVRHCIRSGVLMIAAAGNDGCDCLQVPAALPGVLVVGAMDEHGEPVGFSNWGAAYRDRGILAPGTNIAGAAPGGAVVPMSGTSFATPLVAGAAALLMARQTKDGGRPDARLVMNAIVEGADRCDPGVRDRCERFLAGTLNIDGALKVLEAQARGARGVAPHEAAIRIHESSDRTGRGTMDQERSEAIRASDGDAATVSMHAMAEQLKSIQAAMGDLSRSLGALNLSGLPAEAETPRAAEPTVGVSPSIQAPEPAAPRMPIAPSSYHADRRRRLRTSSQDGNTQMIEPDACCDACAAREARQLVYALGKVGFDYGTEARMDSIQSQMRGASDRKTGKPVFDDHLPSASSPADLVAFLRAKPEVAPAITWTLNLNEAPIYAVRPEGDYLEETYAHLVDTLDEEFRTAAAADAREKDTDSKAPIPPPAVERMALPGIINGEVELMNGLVIPTVRPALAAMYTWSTEALVEALGKSKPTGPNDPDKKGTFNPRDGLRTFLNRIYEELRNVGLASPDRALNFAATNAYQAFDIFVKLRNRNIHIEGFEVVRSPVMRPESDCWDVKMTFFDPEAPTTKPREVYFYTIDVSDVVPVAIGRPRHWTT